MQQLIRIAEVVFTLGVGVIVAYLVDLWATLRLLEGMYRVEGKLVKAFHEILAEFHDKRKELDALIAHMDVARRLEITHPIDDAKAIACETALVKGYWESIPGLYEAVGFARAAIKQHTQPITA
jgi:hypothetical protein